MRSSRPGPWTEVLRCDLGRDEVDPALLQGVDTIFHLAGKAHTRARNVAENAEYEAVHVHGTRSLLRAARQAGVRACVLLSSVKAMGEGGAGVLGEDSPCHPDSTYGRTKLAAEHLVLASGLPCPVVLRPTLVYGAGSKGNLDRMLRAVRRGLFPAIAFPPNARSMIHVEDVVQACLLAATHAAACGRTYILTDGRDYATGEILDWIFEACGRKPGPRVRFGWVRAAARLGDTARGCGLPWPLDSDALDKLAGSARYTNARICRELGFAPTRDLREGIREMVAALSGKG